MDLNEFNEICTSGKFLKTKSWAELQSGTTYKVNRMKIVTTKYGVRIVATINDYEFNLFLPPRVSKILHEDPEKLKLMNDDAAAGKLYIYYIRPGKYYKFEFVKNL